MKRLREYDRLLLDRILVRMLRELRERYRITQERVGGYLGISGKAWSAYERRGRVSFTQFVWILRGMSADIRRPLSPVNLFKEAIRRMEEVLAKEEQEG